MKLDNVMRSFATILVGVLLILMKDSAIHLIVRVIGVALLVPALVSALGIFIRRNDGVSMRDMFISAVDVCCVALGLWLVISPGTFVGLLVVLLSLALFCFSFFQLYRLYVANRFADGNWKYAIVPVLLLLVSIVALALPDRTVSFITMLIGIAALVSGLSDIVISLIVDRKR